MILEIEPHPASVPPSNIATAAINTVRPIVPRTNLVAPPSVKSNYGEIIPTLTSPPVAKRLLNHFTISQEPQCGC